MALTNIPLLSDPVVDDLQLQLKIVTIKIGILLFVDDIEDVLQFFSYRSGGQVWENQNIFA